jgi:hypothetical protein
LIIGAGQPAVIFAGGDATILLIPACFGVRETGERDRETGERDRETERQRDRETERGRDRERDRETGERDRETGERDRETERQREGAQKVGVGTCVLRSVGVFEVP